MFGAGGGGQTVRALTPDYGTEVAFCGQQGPWRYLETCFERRSGRSKQSCRNPAVAWEVDRQKEATGEKLARKRQCRWGDLEGLDWAGGPKVGRGKRETAQRQGAHNRT